MPKSSVTEYSHIPVLLKQAIDYLNPKPGDQFIDATLGGGGYTAELLKKIGSRGTVLSIDLDQSALDSAKHRFNKEFKNKNLILAHGNFAQVDKYVRDHKETYGFNAIDGIVADIGLSSYQLDQSNRGITFQKKEPLDMRFDLSSPEPNARFMLHEYSTEELTQIFKDYGEEKDAKRIAQAIVTVREAGRETSGGGEPLHYTTDLTKIIQKALPKPAQHKWQDSARRVFQALRVAVNHELENLEAFLPKALDLVKPGGVIVIVSFHSLEDRMVKQFFAKAARGCICPKEFPICLCNQIPQAEILTKKPITADPQEVIKNPRSNSAKLRVLRKL